MCACHITRRGGRPCGVYPEETKAFAPNPDPINFEIVAMEQVGAHLVAKIKYPDCTNYEGMKICLFLNMKMKRLSNMKEVDPHFSRKVGSPFARFRPDTEGWTAALKLASNI
jgi:hypothetical protein